VAYFDERNRRAVERRLVELGGLGLCGLPPAPHSRLTKSSPEASEETRVSDYAPLLETLMRLVLDSIIFLERSGEEVVDQRSAVKMFEYMAYRFQEVSPADRAVFLAYAQEMAAEEQRPQVRDLLLSLDAAMFPDEEDEVGD
jgi:hypothetical protein